jgi:phosphopantothenoylcysteine decarboxylase/phosphopantothenate--cysteine ligase
MGLSDNLVTALSLSSDPTKPYLVFPAMNTRMMQALPIQTALKSLEAMNRTLVFGESGYLACGHQGQGRLAEAEFILDQILKVLNTSSNSAINKSLNTNKKIEHKKNKKKILITAGGTSEPIDPVRHVTNTSTGETGLKICDYLSQDYEVYLLGSEVMRPKVKLLFGAEFSTNDYQSIQLSEEKTSEVSLPIHATYYKSFKDLETKLFGLLKGNEFEAIVHLAAVSDYSPIAMHLNEKSVDLPTEEKISTQEDFFIEFKRNKKLITEIKKHSSNQNIKVIGFKLLRTDDQQKIKSEIDKILQDSDCVVVNSLENINEKKHIYEIYNLNGLVFHGNTKTDMAEDISKILKNEVSL